MERSGSQKVLLVISILNIIGAVLGILMGFLMITGGALVGAVDSSEAASALAGSGMTQGELSGIAGIAGIVMLVAAVIELILGILGVRAANDNQKIMPVWIVAIVELVLCIIGLIAMLVNGSFSTEGASTIVSLIFAGFTMWIANNIKVQAGK